MSYEPPTPPARRAALHILDGDEAPSEASFTVVAALEGQSPLELTPLARATDPDALDALLSGDTASTHELSFEYCGYKVTATAMEIHVEPLGGE